MLSGERQRSVNMVVYGVGGVQRRVGEDMVLVCGSIFDWDGFSFLGCIEKISQVGIELMLDLEFIGGVRMVL